MLLCLEALQEHHLCSSLPTCAGNEDIYQHGQQWSPCIKESKAACYLGVPGSIHGALGHIYLPLHAYVRKKENSFVPKWYNCLAFYSKSLATMYKNIIGGQTNSVMPWCLHAPWLYINLLIPVKLSDEMVLSFLFTSYPNFEIQLKSS